MDSLIETAASKKALRIKAKAILKSLGSHRREYAADQAAKHLFAAQYWSHAKNVLVFMAMTLELDTRHVLIRAWKEGKATFIPRVIGRKLEFGQIESFDEPLVKNAYGIREPRADSRLWTTADHSEDTLILVPGMAFDPSGRRLGHGGGFYDGFLAEMRMSAEDRGMNSPRSLGFVFEEQVFPEVPVDRHDERVDGLVSDARLMMF
ncbi:MAG: 5-formyltetrahydrofolate cyclo-ligase [spirochete symbiont of Stewartia floridana]|nr:MAG: 5-formyltetrahydrofolate cyclo-ligase [spirochete symbiont of Stewartia floridana]